MKVNKTILEEAIKLYSYKKDGKINITPSLKNAAKYNKNSNVLASIFELNEYQCRMIEENNYILFYKNYEYIELAEGIFEKKEDSCATWFKKIESNNESEESFEMEALKLQCQKEEAEAYEKEHTMVCPKCGGKAINEAPNGAGILEECDWYCRKCGWEEEIND